MHEPPHHRYSGSPLPAPIALRVTAPSPQFCPRSPSGSPRRRRRVLPRSPSGSPRPRRSFVLPARSARDLWPLPRGTSPPHPESSSPPGHRVLPSRSPASSPAAHGLLLPGSLPSRPSSPPDTGYFSHPELTKGRPYQVYMRQLNKFPV